MNPIQEAIAKVLGVDDEIGELRTHLETVYSDNALLQRQIDDLNYLNLFDINDVAEVIPSKGRDKVLRRLRTLRHENPLAKQSMKLIVRFTLGKGVQLVVTPEPEDPSMDVEEPGEPKLTPGAAPTPQPTNSQRPDGNLPQLPRRRLPVGEAEEDDQLKEIIEDFWTDEENKATFTSHESMKEFLDSTATDGEKFLICIEDSAAPYIKLTEIPVEEIDTIVYHPDNWRIPVYYRRSYIEKKYDGKAEQYKPSSEPKTTYYLDYRITDEQLTAIGNRISIPRRKLAPKEERIYHAFVNPVWTKIGRRGVSELYASREWFRVYKEFMEDRAAINKAATAIAFRRKIKAGPVQVAQFTGKIGDLNVGYDNPQNTTELKRLTRPTAAGIYDQNEAVDLDWMKTDTGAANAKEDARGLIAAAGAGVGTFSHYFGEGGGDNLAVAQAMELPMVKTYEEWQQWISDNILEIIKYVFRIANGAERAQEDIRRVAVNFPPIISQDVVKYMTAWSQVVQNIAPGNNTVHLEAIKGSLSVMGVANLDALMSQIAAEEEALQAKKEREKAEMLANLSGEPEADSSFKGGFNGNLPVTAGGKRAPRNGDSNVMPTELKRVASGRPDSQTVGARSSK